MSQPPFVEDRPGHGGRRAGQFNTYTSLRIIEQPLFEGVGLGVSFDGAFQQ